MDVIRDIESVGSLSGRTSQKVRIPHCVAEHHSKLLHVHSCRQVRISNCEDIEEEYEKQMERG